MITPVGGVFFIKLNYFRREDMKSKVAILGVVILIMVSLFTGCDMLNESSLDETLLSVDSRGGSGSKQTTKQDFQASVTLYQDYEHVVTEKKGKGNHYKTIEETLLSYGGAIESDWDVINGKDVIMTNETSYNLDLETGELSGANHSIINIVDSDGSVLLTLKANGTIKGSLFGAVVDMHFVIEDSYGLDVKGTGDVGGLFVWAVFNPETMSVDYILPSGDFFLTGSYK